MCLGGGGGSPSYDQSWSIDYGRQPPAPVVPVAPEVPDDRNPSVQPASTRVSSKAYTQKKTKTGPKIGASSLKINQPTGGKAGSGGINQ